MDGVIWFYVFKDFNFKKSFCKFCEFVEMVDVIIVRISIFVILEDDVEIFFL